MLSANTECRAWRRRELTRMFVCLEVVGLWSCLHLVGDRVGRLDLSGTLWKSPKFFLFVRFRCPKFT